MRSPSATKSSMRMRWLLLLWILLLVFCAHGQQSIPLGTIIPVAMHYPSLMFNSWLNMHSWNKSRNNVGTEHPRTARDKGTKVHVSH